MPKQAFKQSYQFDERVLGLRLDQAIAQYCPEVSRSKLQEWIKSGQVSVNGDVVTKTRLKLKGNEKVEIEAELEEAGEWQPEAIPLAIVFEDEHLIVVNKPANLVVHPATGNPTGTLVNALLHHQPDLIHLPRAGIIHRLDKDTTGLLVIAKTLEAHTGLVSQLQERQFEREYQCLVHGQLVSGGTVDEPIGRHPTNRILMAINHQGKEAITHFRLKEKFNNFTHLQVNLETGRTHQIRVHMAHLRYPLVGDPLYGRKNYVPSGSSDALKTTIRSFRRQALHARKLGLSHPITGEWHEWQVEPPEDYLQLLAEITREDGLA